MATLVLSFEPKGFLLAEGLGTRPENEARAIVVDTSGPVRTVMSLTMGAERRERLFSTLGSEYGGQFETLEESNRHWIGHADFVDVEKIESVPLYAALAQFKEHVGRAYLSFRPGTANMRIETDLGRPALESIAAMLDALPGKLVPQMAARVVGERELSPQWSKLLPHA